ncbi:hypothetical protein EVAR_98153_1 [Eumeta japonica]|uniref:Uncharacterized protein n=1 Tax=Eumeta variegata TaxID=151549 RepID=A0A4C1XRC0_EUMVA|nr:hypothetical protein EVAR_98153_1 [Eumeta japonica]
MKIKSEGESSLASRHWIASVDHLELAEKSNSAFVGIAFVTAIRRVNIQRARAYGVLQFNRAPPAEKRMTHYPHRLVNARGQACALHAVAARLKINDKRVAFLSRFRPGADPPPARPRQITCFSLRVLRIVFAFHNSVIFPRRRVRFVALIL